MAQSRPVVFAGENPLLMLYQPGSEEVVAAASLWRGTYSEAGAGYVLVLWIDPAASGLGEDALSGIFTDNAALAQLVWTNFNQHFGAFQNRGLDASAVVPARFGEDAGGARFHRITCAVGLRTIELLWQDVRDTFHNISASEFGGASWEIANVVCPCAGGSIVVNGTPVNGEVRQTGGSFQSSAFLAFCESWVRKS